MMKFILAAVIALGLPSQALLAGEVAPTVVAKVMKIIASADPKVSCDDWEVTTELRKQGLQIDRDARVVWSNKDVAAKAAKGKLVVCGQRELLEQGAAIAVVVEDGRPAIYMNLANVAASKVPVPESVLKAAKHG